eukprot:CAMPEP_0169123730 /NCGR_PEP_ID=MMETSP1015-20121227/33945_1 /TAXON_ID=342587 /ORGANISM="Karlodinium micrum, Strain CCMP2283" /LENGTH=140 /DNA_ID=CAMNT_0009187095 /DNA_START=80 /DNA_END=502 /DNA_ORIENTATION=+
MAMLYVALLFASCLSTFARDDADGKQMELEMSAQGRFANVAQHIMRRQQSKSGQEKAKGDDNPTYMECHKAGTDDPQHLLDAHDSADCATGEDLSCCIRTDLAQHIPSCQCCEMYTIVGSPGDTQSYLNCTQAATQAASS